MEHNENGLIGTFEPMCKIRFLSDSKPDEEYIAVPASEMIDLIADQMRLMALDGGGVDNWTWYGDAICESLKEMPNCYDEHFWEWVNKQKAKNETAEEYVADMSFTDYARYEVDNM